MANKKYIIEVEEPLDCFGEWDRLCIPVFMKDGENSFIPCGFKHLRLLTKEDLADLPEYKWSHLDHAEMI